MTSETLDQDALDALLNAAMDEAGGAETDSGSGSGSVSIEMSSFADEIAGAFSTTVTSLTSKEVTLEKENEESSSLEQLSEQFTENIVVGKATFGGDIEAEFAFITDIKAGSILGDLVLMGEGEAKEELSADDLDSLKEMTNQVCGAAAQSLSGILGKKISSGQAELSTINAAEQKDQFIQLLSEGDVSAFTFALKVADLVTSKLHLFIHNSLEKQLVSEPEPPPVPTPEDEPDASEQEVVTAEQEVEQFSMSQEEMTIEKPSSNRNIELIKGIEVNVKIKLGETVMPFKKIIQLIPGTIIELNKNADANLELVVNNQSIAEGVLVVVSSNNFALRVTKILDKAERIKSLGGSGD